MDSSSIKRRAERRKANTLGGAFHGVDLIHKTPSGFQQRIFPPPSTGDKTLITSKKKKGGFCSLKG
jgi:hypothetical protein